MVSKRMGECEHNCQALCSSIDYQVFLAKSGCLDGFSERSCGVCLTPSPSERGGSIFDRTWVSVVTRTTRKKCVWGGEGGGVLLALCTTFQFPKGRFFGTGWYYVSQKQDTHCNLSKRTKKLISTALETLFYVCRVLTSLSTLSPRNDLGGEHLWVCPWLCMWLWRSSILVSGERIVRALKLFIASAASLWESCWASTSTLFMSIAKSFLFCF